MTLILPFRLPRNGYVEVATDLRMLGGHGHDPECRGRCRGERGHGHHGGNLSLLLDEW